MMLINGQTYFKNLAVLHRKIFKVCLAIFSILSMKDLNDLNNISPQFAPLPEDVFVKTLLYGGPIFDERITKYLKLR